MGNLISTTDDNTEQLVKGNIQNPSSCSTMGDCAPGYTRGKDVCTTGWSYSCGQSCAHDNCRKSGGTWIPLDYRNHPYTCRPPKKNIKFPLTLYSNTSYSGTQECIPKEGKYYCKLPKVGSLRTTNEYIAVLFTGSNNDGDFVSTSQNTSGNLLNAKSVALIKQDGFHPVSLSSTPYKKVGPNFWLKYGLYPGLKNVSIGSYTVTSANPYYAKGANDGVMFYADEMYNGKSYYLGKKAATNGQAKMGFVPKSMMVFKADKIYFYQDNDLQGAEIPMDVKAYPDLAETFRTNKSNITKSSSISIPEGFIAFLFNEVKYGGKKLILSAGGYNLPDGWNDNVKSAHFFTLEELKKYQAPSFSQARESYLSENSVLTKSVKVTPGWEKTSYNIVAQNELGGGTCAVNAKAKDLGIYSTQPEKFVLDFYGGLFTKKEAETFAKQYNVPYFGFVVNSGHDISLDKISDSQKLHYFGGFTINSTYTDELKKMNKEQQGLTKLFDTMFMPQSVFGTHLHVFQYEYNENKNTKVCVNFVDKANEMNKYALDINENNCQKLYETKMRISKISDMS